ncbi:MAG: site-specific integrase [Ruminococcus sp.]|nr:site-specific integrase [Ruminococcus sp.]
MMTKTFEELSKLYLEKECIGKDYSYCTELKSNINHLNRYFSTKSPEKIKGIDVDDFLNFLYLGVNPNNNKPYSKRLLTGIISTGYRLYEFALDNELLPNMRNPFSGKKKKIPKNAPKKERKPIDEYQKKMILSVFHRTQLAALIMLYCGLRKGEIIALEWQDVDLNNKIISITKSAVRYDSNNYIITSHTKNGKDRYVPIPDNLIPFLQISKYNTNSKYVFSQNSGKLHTMTSWKRAWDSYQNELNYSYYVYLMEKTNRKPKNRYDPSGIPKVLEKFTAHQLRHTYCTMLYLSEVDIKTTSQLMGHSSVDITLEVYTHLDAKYKKLNINKYNNYLNNSSDNKIMQITDKIVQLNSAI